MSAARTGRMRKRPRKPSDSSNEPTQSEPYQFLQGRLAPRDRPFLPPMNALHPLLPIPPNLVGRRPPGAGGLRLVRDRQTKFAIDPMADAQRYPKNEQPK